MTSIIYENPPVTMTRPNGDGRPVGSKHALRDLAWFTMKTGAAQNLGTPLSTIATITPELAAVMLEKNTSNRKVTKQHVKVLASAMERGEWRMTHEAIAFSKSGRLLDGQHRLLAVIASGVPIETTVVFGLDDDAFSVINIGRNRTATDALSMVGASSVHVLAAVARACINLSLARDSDMPAMHYKGKLSNAQILGWVERTPEAVEAIGFFHVARGAFSAIASGYVAGLVFILKAGASRETVREFNDLVASGVGLDSKGHPILRLRQVYANQAVGYRRVKSAEHATLCVKAWNAWRAGEEIGLLGVKSNERFPAQIRL